MQLQAHCLLFVQHPLILVQNRHVTIGSEHFVRPCSQQHEETQRHLLRLN